MGDPVSTSLLAGSAAQGIGAGAGKKGGGGPSPEMRQMQALQGATAITQMPATFGQIQQQKQYLEGNRALDDTFMGGTLVGPQNLAYKKAKERAIADQQGGMLNQALGQIEAGRAYQDAQARQAAHASMLGPVPMLGGYLQSTGAAGNTAGQISGLNMQSQGLTNQAFGGAGQLAGLGLAGKGKGDSGGGAGITQTSPGRWR